MTRDEVVVSFGTDSSLIERGLRGVERSVEGTVERIVHLGKHIGAGILAGFAINAIEAKMHAVIEQVEQMSNKAKALNISTDFLQDIENVGKASGITAEEVEKMIVKFTRTLPAGSDVEQSFYKMADRLAGIPDPAERARTAVKEFGKTGVDMIAMAGNGAEALREMASEFKKLSGDDIGGILAAKEQLNQLSNTTTVWAGKTVAAISYAGEFWGRVFGKNHGLTDLLLGESNITGEIAGEKSAKAAADKKKDDERKKAAAIAAANEQAEANLKIYKEYVHKKNELDNGLSTETRISNLALEKITEERAAKASKSFKEEYQHKTRVLEIDHEINTLKDEQHKKQREADKIQEEGALRIAEIHKREHDKFLPTLEELSHHGGFRGQARQISRLERKIKRDFEFGNIGQGDKDIASRNQIYDSLADRGVVSERSERREIKEINSKMAADIKKITDGKVAIKIQPALK